MIFSKNNTVHLVTLEKLFFLHNLLSSKKKMQFPFYLLSLQTEGCDINSIDETGRISKTIIERLFR